MTALILGMLLVIAGAAWPSRPRRRASPMVRQQYRRAAEQALAQAQRDGVIAMQARANIRAALRKLKECEWDAAYWGDTHPDRSQGIGANVPRMQASINTYAHQADQHDKAVAKALQQARTAQRALAKADPPARQAPDLVVLAQVCWKGWLASRRNHVLY